MTGTGAPPSGNVALTGNGLVGLQVNLEAPAEVAGEVFLVGPGKTKSVGEIAVGDSELEVPDAGVGTILDGYDRVTFGPDGRPADLVRGDRRAGRRDAPAHRVERRLARRLVAARRRRAARCGCCATTSASSSRASREGNLINVRFHGEHMVNIVEGEPIVNLDGLGGPDNPGDGVGLARQGRARRLPAADRAGRDGHRRRSRRRTTIAAEAAPSRGRGRGRRPQACSASIAANGATCAKAQTLAAARNCVRTIDRLEEQVVQQYRLINRFAARTPIFSLAPAEGS